MQEGKLDQVDQEDKAMTMQPARKISGCDFEWREEGEAVLKDVNSEALDLEGQLSMIAGAVGSGRVIAEPNFEWKCGRCQCQMYRSFQVW